MGIEPTCQIKIKEVVLRQTGCLKGVRLRHMASVREYILTQMEALLVLPHINPSAPFQANDQSGL